MNIPTNLLILEAGGGYELLDSQETYDASLAQENTLSDEVIVISGKITVSP